MLVSLHVVLAGNNRILVNLARHPAMSAQCSGAAIIFSSFNQACLASKACSDAPVTKDLGFRPYLDKS